MISMLMKGVNDHFFIYANSDFGNDTIGIVFQRDSEVFSRNVSHHLTLSSPTIDSTTDLNGNSAFPFKRPKSTRQPSQESQDSSAATSSLSMDGDSSDAWQWIMSTETVAGDGSGKYHLQFLSVTQVPSPQ